jgi:hypothetical protein
MAEHALPLALEREKEHLKLPLDKGKRPREKSPDLEIDYPVTKIQRPNRDLQANEAGPSGLHQPASVENNQDGSRSDKEMEETKPLSDTQSASEETDEEVDEVMEVTGMLVIYIHSHTESR